MWIRTTGAILRVAVGVAFLAAGALKFLDAGFLYGGVVHRLDDFGDPFPFFRTYVLLRVVEPHQDFVAHAVPAAEIAIGLAFLLGVFVSWAALSASLLVISFGFAIGYGSSWILPVHVAFALLLLVMGRAAAGLTWGLDALLVQRLPAALVLFPFRRRLPPEFRRPARAAAGDYSRQVHRGRR